MDNPFPGVPLVHSPLFEQLLPATGWDEETVRVAASLHRDGYAVVDFQEPELDALIADLQVNITDGLEWDLWRAGEKSDLRAIDAWKFNPSIRRIAANAHMRRLLSTVYGRPAFPFQTINFPVGSQQSVHADLIHFASVPEHFMCGVWLALEDIDPAAGPLIYYPGSHRWPVLHNEHLGLAPAPHDDPYVHHQAFDAAWTQMRQAYGAEPAVFHPKKGQALIWAANLHHGGMPHTDKSRTRHSQVTHYLFRDCAYWTPLTSSPFTGRIAFRPGICDVETGETVPQSVAGVPVPEDFMSRTAVDVAESEAERTEAAEATTTPRPGLLSRLFGRD